MQFFKRKIWRAVAIWLLCVTALPVSMAEAAGKKAEFTVVIDAGHGGKDPGTQDNGASEKDINLAVALKLGDLIRKKLKDTKVIYTRDDDTFVSLQGRADIANKAGADLFISIHTNSVDKSNANRANVSGVSTYVLNLDKDSKNLDVARRENQVIEYDANDKARFSSFDPHQDESYIIFEMTQKKNFQNSIRLAKDIQEEMQKAGRKPHGHGVHQAGFWVLWSTAMPAVLVELDFICNPEQARFLTSNEGQDKLASAIFNAVKKYEDYYRRSTGTASSTKNTDPKQKKADYPRKTKEDVEREVAAAKKSRTTKEKRNQPIKDEEPATIEFAAATSSTEGTEWEPAEGQEHVANRRSANRRSRARKQSLRTEYRIVLFTSENHLQDGDSSFKGLSPISTVRENNIYKYTYGRGTSPEDLQQLLADVRELFPEAAILDFISE